MRLLLIEDEDKVASFIEKGLREEFYSVDRALDGRKGLELSSIHQYDLILLDLTLPRIDGLDVCREMRRRGLSCPVIMLTARTAVDQRIEGLDAGADDYLCKPFDFGELLARVRALLRRKSETVETALKCADLEMNLVKRSVSRDGREIELTAREFALLEYMLRNKGRVLTRTSIIEHVWDMHFDSDTNLVDVFIRYLRIKLDEPFDRKLIKTRRGAGYYLEDI